MSEPVADRGGARARRMLCAFLGALFVLAFADVWTQVDGLLGSGGIFPAGELAGRIEQGPESWWQRPGLLLVAGGDVAIHALCAVGCLAGVVLAAGLAPRPSLAVLWIAWLSLVNAAEEFLFAAGDVLLLEAAVVAFFLVPRGPRPDHRAWQEPPSAAARVLLLWLLFRLAFEDGLDKLLAGEWLFGDAFRFHLLTQSLPAPMGAELFWWPGGLLATVGTLIVLAQLAGAVLMLVPGTCRRVAWTALTAVHAVLWVTSNHGIYHPLVLVLLVLLLDDAPLRRPAAPRGEAGRWRAPVRNTAAALLVAVTALEGVYDVGPLPEPVPSILTAARPFRSTNSYAMLGPVDRERRDWVIEGTTDGNAWHRYGLASLPLRKDEAPDWHPFGLPRLDWRMTFASREYALRQPMEWLRRVLRRLLEGSPDVAGLLRHDPFPDRRPDRVRVLQLAVTYESPALADDTGNVWQWGVESIPIPPRTLEELR